MRALFEKDMQASKLVTLEKWKQRSIGARLKESAARLWARWL
jgi:cardiolipin synthase